MNGMALCAGAGGLELGLHIALGADYRCVVYVEREAYAAATLVARMADQALDTAPVWDDVTTFYGKPWSGVVDLVSAGFSCQPWSSAGKRLGVEDERWIWPDIDRVIREVGPEWVFLENVSGLVHGGLEHVLRDLAAQGFDAEWDCVSAAEVGAPQLRERLYILARRGVGLADAHNDRFTTREVDGTKRCGESQPLRSRSAVADADGEGLVGLRRQSTHDEYAWDDVDGRSRPSTTLDHADDRRYRWTDHEVRSGRDRPERTGSLALADGPRSEVVATPAGASAPAGCLPYWPPDRSYQAKWPSGLEPAVRRVADGMAPWVDRLRLTGNGVVPLAAAVAFIRLRDRLMGDKIDQQLELTGGTVSDAS